MKEKEDQEMHTSSQATESEDPDLPLATSLEKLILELPRISRNRCIYRVPTRLRSLNEKAYTPQVVSIGPLHHGKKELQFMEEYKVRRMKAFLLHANMPLRNCVKAMKKWEERARNCYAERIDLNSDEFMRIIIVDSCFIIEAILSDYASTDVLEDMILLENQIPLFVLDGLYHQAFPDESLSGTETFLGHSIRFFEGLALGLKDVEKMTNNVNRHLASGSEVNHFVDLLRICHLPSALRSPPVDQVKLLAIPSAVELHEARMNFRASSNSLLEIQYTTRGVLEIPPLTVEDTSEILLRNLIALEQCHYSGDTYISDYIFFMDMLINTAKDVEILIQNKIIESWLADTSAVATLFNNLGMGNLVRGSNYYYHGISEKLNAYYNVPWNMWKATLKRDYFKTPWMIVSTIAAVVLLVLTFIQTVCSIISL